MATSSIHDCSRHQSLYLARFLSALDAKLHSGQPTWASRFLERSRRSGSWCVAIDAVDKSLSRLGHHCPVDCRVSSQHVRLAALARAIRYQPIRTFHPPATPSRLHCLGLVVHSKIAPTLWASNQCSAESAP